MNILVINAGSSSLKYQLMDPKSGSVMAKGLCERINLDGRLTHKVPARDLKVTREIPMPTHKEAIEAVMQILVDPENGVISSVDEIDAVGHRVLHGGDKFVASCVVDEACKQAIRDCFPCTTRQTSWASKPVKRPCPARPRSPSSIRRSI